MLFLAFDVEGLDLHTYVTSAPFNTSWRNRAFDRADKYFWWLYCIKFYFLLFYIETRFGYVFNRVDLFFFLMYIKIRRIKTDKWHNNARGNRSLMTGSTLFYSLLHNITAHRFFNDFNTHIFADWLRVTLKRTVWWRHHRLCYCCEMCESPFLWKCSDW